MRHTILGLALLLVLSPAFGQSFTIETSRPQHGAVGVASSDTVAFAFNRQVSIGTDWNTAFVYEPRDALTSRQVSLCLNFQGRCDGGDDIPRFVRFQVEHEANTDYTWLVYAVETIDGEAMTEPYVLRYTTASTIGQGAVQGQVTAQRQASASVQATLRQLADGLQRSNRGQPVFTEGDGPQVQRTAAPGSDGQPQSILGTMGKAAAQAEGPFTQILLVDEFSIRESDWNIRAADVLIGSSGSYRVDYVRDGSYVPIAVRYTDGTNAEIDALGFHDPDGDGTPNAVEVSGNTLSGIDLQLFAFSLTSARAQTNFSVARNEAARYAQDQELKLIEGGMGMRPSGMAYVWTFRFYSPSQDLETAVTVDPLGARVDTTEGAPAFLTEMSTVPDGFVDSDDALQVAMQDGGQAFTESFRASNLTTLLAGGNQFWTDSPQPEEEFWRVRIIGVTSTRVEIFERYIDMETGELLTPPDTPGIPEPPANLSAQARDAEVALGWAPNSEADLTEYRLYRATAPGTGGSETPDPSNRIATVAAGTEQYSDTDVENGQAYYYRVTAVDTDGNESTASNEASAFPLPSRFSVDASIRFGEAHTTRDYRLVALPGDVNTSLASTLSGSEGTAWTAYWDNGDPQDFLVAFDGSSTFNFRPGRGFWLLATSAWTASQSVPMMDLADDGTATIPLHDGWNIISNPLDVNVAWSAVQAANEVTQFLWEWGGSFRETNVFTSARTGQAFYFLNEQGLDALKIPYPGAPGTVTEAPPVASAEALTLEAYQGETRVAAVQAGVADAAHAGRDAYDQVAPPGYFETASLRLVNEAVDATYTELAAEYRRAHRDGHAFALTLRAEPGQTIRLRADHLDAFAGQQVVLLHPASGRTYDLHASSTVPVQPTTASTDFKLLVGSEAFVEGERQRVLPAEIKLLPNYPNPFQGQTTLEYALPEAQAVELSIYDVLGRRVRTLVDGDEQRAGVHHIPWDGRNDAGQGVASGIYLGRLRVDGRVEVQRLVLVR